MLYQRAQTRCDLVGSIVQLTGPDGGCQLCFVGETKAGQCFGDLGRGVVE